MMAHEFGQSAWPALPEVLAVQFRRARAWLRCAVTGDAEVFLHPRVTRGFARSCAGLEGVRTLVAVELQEWERDAEAHGLAWLPSPAGHRAGCWASADTEQMSGSCCRRPRSAGRSSDGCLGVVRLTGSPWPKGRRPHREMGVCGGDPSSLEGSFQEVREILGALTCGQPSLLPLPRPQGKLSWEMGSLSLGV